MGDRRIFDIALSGGMLFFLSILGNIVTNQPNLGWLTAIAIAILVAAAIWFLWMQERMRSGPATESRPPQEYRPNGTSPAPPSPPPYERDASRPPDRPPPGGTVYRSGQGDIHQDRSERDTGHGSAYPGRAEHHPGWDVPPQPDVTHARPVNNARRIGWRKDWAITTISVTAAILVLDGVTIDTESRPLWITTLLATAAVLGFLSLVLQSFLRTFGGLLYALTLGLIDVPVKALLLMLASWAAPTIGLPFHVGGFWPDAVLTAY